MNALKNFFKKVLKKIRNCAIITTIIGIVGALIAASETILYLTSNGKADLSFIIKKASDTDNEREKERLRKADMEWFSKQAFESFSIKSKDGHSLKAVYLPAPGNSNKTAFCIHGIQSTGIREFATAAKYFYENGINSFIIDQRACGKSGGKYVTYGAKESEDCKLWLDFVANHFGPDMRVFVYGVSMGSSTTLLLNNYELPSNIEYMVADCGYASVKDQIKNTFKSVHLPSGICYFMYKTACKCHRIYNPDKVDILGAVRKCRLPILFVHGAIDDVVPIENAYLLYENCNSTDKKLLVPDNVGHSQSFALSMNVREAIIKKINNN